MAKLKALIQGYKGDLQKVARDSALELGNRVQSGTPVDTSQAIRAWESEGGFGPGQKYTYLNNTPYIRKLEYGHSDQAPNGMLRINVRNWQSIVDGQIKK